MSILKTPTPDYYGSGQPQPAKDSGIGAFLRSLWATPTPAYHAAIEGVNPKRTKRKAQHK
jgi:hypothetical protein